MSCVIKGGVVLFAASLWLRQAHAQSALPPVAPAVSVAPTPPSLEPLPEPFDWDPRDGSTFATRPWRLEFRTSIGGVAGALGVIPSYTWSNWLTVGAGAGVDLEGVQGGAIVRSRPGAWQTHAGWLHAVSVEFGYSLGEFQARGLGLDVSDGSDDLPAGQPRADLAGWLQLDVGWEYQTLSGTWLRVSLGAASIVHLSGADCTEPSGCRPPKRGFTIPTASFAVGPAFGMP